jgi:hypothetical protein
MPKNNNNPTPTEEAFAYAVAKRIPPFNWIPPENYPLKKSVSTRNPKGYSTSLKQIKASLPLKGSSMIQSPIEKASDYRHLDLDKFTKLQNDLADTEMKLAAAQKGVAPSGKIEKLKAKLYELQARFDNADRVYKRLEVAFNRIVLQIGLACRQLNDAIVKGSPQDYSNARAKYMALLKYLDTHEAEEGTFDPARIFQNIDNPKKFGYGEVLMWNFVDPVIEACGEHNLITGITVVSEWKGYHTSSSGVPIKDP